MESRGVVRPPSPQARRLLARGTRRLGVDTEGRRSAFAALSMKKFYRHSSLELARRIALGEIHQKPARITLERQAKPGEHACLDGSFRPLSYPVDMEGRLWEECAPCHFLNRLTLR